MKVIDFTNDSNESGDIPQRLRELADEMDSGERDVRHVFLGFNDKDVIHCCYLGCHLPKYQALGILELFKAQILNEDCPRVYREETRSRL